MQACRRTRLGKTPRAAVAVAVAIGVSLATPALSEAQSSKLPTSGGSTTLTLSAAGKRALQRAHARLRTIGSSLSGQGLTLPIGEGSADPINLQGSAHLQGQLQFTAGNHKLKLLALVQSTGSPSSITAQFGASGRHAFVQLDLGALGAKVTRKGFSTTISGVPAKLSAAAARAIDAALRTNSFTAGMTLGSITTVGEFSQDAAASGSAQLTLDPTLLAQMLSEGIQLLPTPPATLDGAQLTTPISGGTFTIPNPFQALASSSFVLEGGLVLSNAVGSVPLGTFKLNFDGSSLTLTATNPLSLSLTDLFKSLIPTVDLTNRTITVPNVPLTVSGQLAAQLALLGLNVPAGSTLGTLNLTVHGA